ncbi:hypothetical protein TrVE_jg3630 [Triparma verrucosa]|uniref:PET hydrolase/cutinase-like domain-containing protein n=1 Tax=Triparma verrucosa TaxID=1606542 RepID=A0A9W7BKJ7_9STRA|nr:hypothetical protein TrVE_jg3630 [Triparma verrucosa]
MLRSQFSLSLLSAFGLFSLACGAHRGPFEVSKEDVDVEGYVCGGDQGAVVYYPSNSDNPSPLISFAHGYKAGGDKVDPSYKTLLEGVASWGYVIIALKSAPSDFCWQETDDQIRSMEWIKTSKFADIIDYGKKTGLLGHSMGGAATHLSANNADVVTAYNIGAAVALHPVYVAGSSKVPILYGTGSNDTVVPPSSVKPQYDATQGVAKVYANIEGATHFEPNTVPPNRWTDYTKAFFDCHLSDSEEGCDVIFGSGENSLCSGEVAMTECIFDGAPSSQDN